MFGTPPPRTPQAYVCPSMLLPEDPTVKHVLDELCTYLKKRKLRLLDIFLSRGLLTHVAGNDFAATEKLVKSGCITPGTLTHILAKLLRLSPKETSRAVRVICRTEGWRSRIELQQLEHVLRRHRSHFSTERVAYLNHLMLRENVKEELFKRAQVLNGRGIRPDQSLRDEANNAANMVVGCLETAVGTPVPPRRTRPASARVSRRHVRPSRQMRPKSAGLVRRPQAGTRSHAALPIDAAAQEMLQDIGPQLGSSHPMFYNNDTFDDFDLAEPQTEEIRQPAHHGRRPEHAKRVFKWTSKTKELDAQFRRKMFERWAHLRSAFRSMDNRGEGTLDASDLRVALRKLNLTNRGSALEDLISYYIDTGSADKHITWDDFQRLFRGDVPALGNQRQKGVIDNNRLKRQEQKDRAQQSSKRAAASMSTKQLLEIVRANIQERFKSVHEAFRKFDKGRNGVLHKDDFETMMGYFNIPKERVSDLMLLFDSTELDGVWSMDFLEFEENFGDLLSAKSQAIEERFQIKAAARTRKPIYKEVSAKLLDETEDAHRQLRSHLLQQFRDLNSAFRYIDQPNRSGTINKAQLAKVLERFNIGSAPVEKLMHRYADIEGEGGDPEVSFEEFMKIFSKAETDLGEGGAGGGDGTGGFSTRTGYSHQERMQEQIELMNYHNELASEDQLTERSLVALLRDKLSQLSKDSMTRNGTLLMRRAFSKDADERGAVPVGRVLQGLRIQASETHRALLLKLFGDAHSPQKVDLHKLHKAVLPEEAAAGQAVVAVSENAFDSDNSDDDDSEYAYQQQRNAPAPAPAAAPPSVSEQQAVERLRRAALAMGQRSAVQQYRSMAKVRDCFELQAGARGALFAEQEAFGEALRKYMRLRLDQQLLAALCKKFDKAGKGVVSFDEFHRFVSGVIGSTHRQPPVPQQYSPAGRGPAVIDMNAQFGM